MEDSWKNSEKIICRSERYKRSKWQQADNGGSRMTETEVKNKLNAYRNALQESHEAREECILLRREIESLKSPIISDMPKAKGGAIDLSDQIARLDAKYQVLKKKEDAVVAAYNMVNDMLSKLSLTESLALRYRYLCLLRWDEVAIKMNFDERTVYRVYKKAIRNLKSCQ